MNAQKYWRRIASGTLIMISAMAIYAVTTKVLRDTFIFFADTVGKNINSLTPQHSFLFCFIYWTIFAILLFTTFYIAVLDMRYIRMQFSMNKQALIKEAWEDEDFRKLLKNVHEEDKTPET